MFAKNRRTDLNYDLINKINSIGDFVIGSIPNIEKYSGGSVRYMITEIF